MVIRNSQVQHPLNDVSRETSVLKVNNDEKFGRPSEEIEIKKTKKISLPFSKTDCRTSGALSKREWLVLKFQVPVQSGTTLGVSRKCDRKNQRLKTLCFEIDCRRELGSPLNKWPPLYDTHSDND